MDLIKCKRCESVVSESNINRDEKVANCQRCGALFSFEETDRKTLLPPKEKILIEPKGIHIENRGIDLLISSKMDGFAKGFFTFFSLFWNAIVFVFVFTALASKNYEILLFISIHLTVGLAIAYYTISLYINKYEIIVDKRHLKTQYGPMKFPFKKTHYVESGLIKQVFCQKYVAGTVNNVPQFSFKVSIYKNDTATIDLLKGLKSYNQALYIEQQIESFINIIDAPIEGEYRET